MSFQLGRTLEARGRERPDYTVFTFPAATLADAASEEIEVDQALSLTGRRGRDFLGVGVVAGVLDEMVSEQSSLTFADKEIRGAFRLATRTGQFEVSDPELLWYWQVAAAWGDIQQGTDAGGGLESLHVVSEGGNEMLGEPFLYVAPRLFWRFTNDFDRNTTIDTMFVRWGSVSVALTFPIFIELLERFADVTLL